MRIDAPPGGQADDLDTRRQTVERLRGLFENAARARIGARARRPAAFMPVAPLPPDLFANAWKDKRREAVRLSQ
ncbi:MAG: hypothetical protein AAGF90_17935, partial [Pseudomonadota bacterium]